jgi:GST-like protein
MILHTAPTPNGWKISCALEELELPYEVKVVNLMKGEQKTTEFKKINPNARIPALEDPEQGQTIFESGAILLYLAQKTGRLMPTDPKRHWQAMSWLMFQMGGVGPMMGQANVFYRYFPEKIPAAIERYQKESHRLLTVLNDRLADHEFLADEFSMADIASWCWAKTYAWSGVKVNDLPHLQRWIKQIKKRPGCARGILVPGKIKSEDVSEAGKNLVT